jgi:hypothetical protein
VLLCPIRHLIASADQVEDGERQNLRSFTDLSVWTEKEVIGFLLTGIISIQRAGALLNQGPTVHVVVLQVAQQIGLITILIIQLETVALDKPLPLDLRYFTDVDVVKIDQNVLIRRLDPAIAVAILLITGPTPCVRPRFSIPSSYENVRCAISVDIHFDSFNDPQSACVLDPVRDLHCEVIGNWVFYVLPIRQRTHPDTKAG